MSEDPNIPQDAMEEPGGPDAIVHEDGPGGPTGRDLPSGGNPEDDEMPEEVTEPDDHKEQGPDEDASSEAPEPPA